MKWGCARKTTVRAQVVCLICHAREAISLQQHFNRRARFFTEVVFGNARSDTMTTQPPGKNLSEHYKEQNQPAHDSMCRRPVLRLPYFEFLLFGRRIAPTK